MATTYSTRGARQVGAKWQPCSFFDSHARSSGSGFLKAAKILHIHAVQLRK